MTWLLLSDTLLHKGKAETTSLDESGDEIVLSEQEASEDNNKQAYLENPQEEDLGIGDNIDSLTEAVGKMNVGGGASSTNKAFSMELSFPFLLYNCEAKELKVVTVNFLVFGQNKKCFTTVPLMCRTCWISGSISL